MAVAREVAATESVTFGRATNRRVLGSMNELAFQATHDDLTGAVNRVLLLDRIQHALSRERHREPLAVMYLDLDRFKAINDTLGHEVGDEVLVEIARRITSVLRPSDTLGRFGGDEFVVLCEEISSEQAVRIAERIVGRGLFDCLERDGHRHLRNPRPG